MGGMALVTLESCSSSSATARFFSAWGYCIMEGCGMQEGIPLVGGGFFGFLKAKASFFKGGGRRSLSEDFYMLER